MPDSKTVDTVLMMLFNGKHCGAGMIVSPFGVINDGLCDITYVHDRRQMGFFGVVDILDKASKKGGI